MPTERTELMDKKERDSSIVKSDDTRSHVSGVSSHPSHSSHSSRRLGYDKLSFPRHDLQTLRVLGGCRVLYGVIHCHQRGVFLDLFLWLIPQCGLNVTPHRRSFNRVISLNELSFCLSLLHSVCLPLSTNYLPPLSYATISPHLLPLSLSLSSHLCPSRLISTLQFCFYYSLKFSM